MKNTHISVKEQRGERQRGTEAQVTLRDIYLLCQQVYLRIQKEKGYFSLTAGATCGFKVSYQFASSLF